MWPPEPLPCMRLMRQVMQAATERAPLLWLDVLQENTRAVQFYQRFGFASAGEDTYAIGAQRFSFLMMQRRTP